MNTPWFDIGFRFVNKIEIVVKSPTNSLNVEIEYERDSAGYKYP